jgi:hypothetical protein
MKLKAGDSCVVREDAYPVNGWPCETGQVEVAIDNPVDGPIYLVFMDDYECTTVYEWEIEKL